ncbi:hypothetical protein C8J57DRAFT_1505503 [Mycena rebaudengoi]|nr:hypothetical protein C8J57DRAFT_1505503 [Mycena rebaudengoi]
MPLCVPRASSCGACAPAPLLTHHAQSPCSIFRSSPRLRAAFGDVPAQTPPLSIRGGTAHESRLDRTTWTGTYAWQLAHPRPPPTGPLRRSWVHRAGTSVAFKLLPRPALRLPMRHHFTRRICALRTLPLDTTRQVPRTAPSHAAITRTSSSTPGAPALPIAESCLTLPLAHCDTTLSRTLSHAARVLGRRHPLATHTRARTRLDGRQPCVLRSRVPLVIHFASQRATIARARRRRVLPAGSPAHPAAILHAAAPPVHHPPTNILAYPARALHLYVPEVHVSAARHSPTSWCTTIARARYIAGRGPLPGVQLALGRDFMDSTMLGPHDLVSQSSLEGACLRHASVPPVRRYIRPPLVRSHAARLRARMSNGLRSSSPVNNVRSPSASRVDEEVRTRPLRHCMPEPVRSAPSTLRRVRVPKLPPPRPALREQRSIPFRTHHTLLRPRTALEPSSGNPARSRSAPPTHVPSAPAASRTQHASAPLAASARPAATAPPRPSRAALDPLPHAPHASPPTDRALHCLPRIPRGLPAMTRYLCPALTGFLKYVYCLVQRSPGHTAWGLKEKVAVRVGAMPAYLLCASSAVSCTTHCGPIAVFSEHRESPSASLMGDVVPT